MAGYTVQDTRQVQTLTQAGSMKQVYRVWISTDNGATGAVDVAPGKWNEDDLPEILSNFADTLDLAFSVSGD